MFGNSGMDPKMLKLLGQCMANHPKLPAFITGVKEKGAAEGMEIAVAVRYPDGTEQKAGVRVKASDLELLNYLAEKGKNLKG